jgi:hypothetical protein
MEQDNSEVRSVDLGTVEIDDVGPPPPDFTNSYETLQEWLFSICDKEQPQKAIETYSIGLFEGEEEYTISLVGTNKYQEDKHRLVINIDFEPEDTYFNLPDKEYKTLKREQVMERLTAQLKEFTKTDKFQLSFFAKAGVITTEWNGATIWSK